MDICYRYRNDNRLITHIDIHRFDRISSPRKKRRKESNHPVLEKFPLLLFPRTTIKLRAKFRRERGGGEINRKKSRNETNRAKAFHFSKISPVVVINYHRVLHRYRIKIRETIPETRDRLKQLERAVGARDNFNNPMIKRRPSSSIVPSILVNFYEF